MVFVGRDGEEDHVVLGEGRGEEREERKLGGRNERRADELQFGKAK